MSDLTQRLRAKAEQIRHDRPDTLGANLSALLIEAADAIQKLASGPPNLERTT